jgi:S-adenosylmethionine:tRNA ribosyltransferase-isomerase
MFSLDDYHYELPPEQIAQAPAERRDASRLLHLDRTAAPVHRRFDQLPDLLRFGDVLVVNDTAVVPARLLGRKESGGRVEVFLLDYAGGTRTAGGGLACECLIRASKPTRSGARLCFGAGLSGTVLRAGGGTWQVEFAADGDVDAALEQAGHVPLPPYIRRPDRPDDRAAYQTVYAAVRGAVAAPTAGLHFTPALLARLRARGIPVLTITLHVGYGTFAPVRVQDIREHRMHAERFAVPPATAAQIAAARAGGGRVVAVGTTVVRTLEHSADEAGIVRPGSGSCELFIYPGYRFKIVDAMVTNFHLPGSTLLMLVSAFAGRERVLAAYREAVRAGYRFFSYGDAMLLE